MDKNLYRVFSGIKKRNTVSYTYAIVILHDDQYDQFEPVNIKVKGSDDGFHRAVLLSLIDAMQRIESVHKDKYPAEIQFYSKCDDAAFEWMTELAEDGDFSPQTRDRDLWVYIKNIVDQNRFKLQIFGTDSVLTGVTGAIRIL